MSWFIEGTGERLQIGLKESGNLSIWGTATSHDAGRGGGDDDYDFIERLNGAECSWSIHPSTEDKLYLDGMSTGFYERIQENPAKSSAKISFQAGRRDLVGVTIALAPDSFQSAKSLFEHVLINRELAYVITLEFHGFRHPDAETDTPSISEFIAGSLDGKVYISRECSVLIRRDNRNV